MSSNLSIAILMFCVIMLAAALIYDLSNSSTPAELGPGLGMALAVPVQIHGSSSHGSNYTHDTISHAAAANTTTTASSGVAAWSPEFKPLIVEKRQDHEMVVDTLETKQEPPAIRDIQWQEDAPVREIMRGIAGDDDSATPRFTVVKRTV